MYPVFQQISPTWPYLTAHELERITTPVFVAGGNKEMYAGELFATQTYLQAGSNQLEFFAVADDGTGLTNLEAAGMLPKGQYFNIKEVRCHVVLPAANGADPAVWADMDNIINVGRPLLTLKVNGKPFGPKPLANCVAKGGLTGGANSMADATATSQAYANNGHPGAPGWDLEWGVWIQPMVTIRGVIKWHNAQAVAADTPIRVELHGHHYRDIN